MHYKVNVSQGANHCVPNSMGFSRIQVDTVESRAVKAVLVA